MLTCFNVQKHIFQILYIIVGPLCPASLKRFVFYKVPPSDKHSLLWLAEHHKPHRKCNSPFNNPAFKINVKTVNNVHQFKPRWEQSCVTDSDEACMCLHTSRGCLTVSPALTHTHDSCCAVIWPPLSHTQAYTTRKTPHLNSQQQIPIFKYW